MDLHRHGVFAASLLIGATAALGTQPPAEMPMATLETAVELRAAAPPPLRLAERLGAQIAYLLPAWQVAPLELEEISLWNRMGKTPAMIGFVRMLPEAQRVGLGDGTQVRATGGHSAGRAQRTVDGALVWGAEVHLEDADHIRLRLSEVTLPAGTLMWVYGEGEESVGPFGLELLDPERALWTPSVAGPALRLEVRLPAVLPEGEGGAGFLIDRALEIVGPGTDLRAGTTLAPRAGECTVDSRCVGSNTFPVIQPARRGVGGLSFVKGLRGFACTGGLLNNEAPVQPLLLTAHHCFDTQASASSLEVFWDFFTTTCDGAAPSLGNLPRSNGSTLLSTDSRSDHTLVALHSVPPERVLLGWSAFPEAAAHDTVIHRISHPRPGSDWLPQRYSRNRVSTSAQACQGAPRPRFLYTTFQPGHGLGGTFGGSSGAPGMNAAGQVLEQLLGGCGPNPGDGCDDRNSEVGGAFSETFRTIGKFLLQTVDTPCIADATTLCLHGNRFQIEVEWEDFSNVVREANVVQGAETSQSGLFYFLDPSNWEFLVKVLNACALNNRYWVFFAGTTNVGFTLRVTDTSDGSVRLYNNILGQQANAITDTNAFATCS